MSALETVKEFCNTYWYVFVIIGVAILLFIYSKQDAYTKMQIKKVFSKPVLFVIFVMVGWFAWWKRGYFIDVNEAHRWMPIIILTISTTFAYFQTLKYKTPQVITPNFHASFSRAPININGFLIFACDTFSAGGFNYNYAERILIVREETCELLEKTAISIARVSQTPLSALDDDVIREIENNKHLKSAKEQIFYGWFDNIERIDWDFQQLKKLDEKKKDRVIYNLIKKELGVDNPKFSTLYWLYRNQCKATSTQTTQFDNAISSTEKGGEHQKRMKDVYAPREKEKHKFEGSEGE